jgi:hypothetical protein
MPKACPGATRLCIFILPIYVIPNQIYEYNVQVIGLGQGCGPPPAVLFLFKRRSNAIHQL